MSVEREGGLDIAVVGGGIAGVTAAHHLSKRHRVTLFEKERHVGGHTHTFVVDRGPDAGVAVDTGFIVYNEKTYPNFCRFLDSLGVAGRDSDVSYGYHDAASGLQFAGHNVDTMFAQRANLFNPSFLSLVAQIPRFHARGRDAVKEGTAQGLSVSQWCEQEKFTPYFVRHFLQPMGAALWSTGPDQIGDFPAEALLRFFYNHGLLALRDFPRWRTVQGGSHTYVAAFLRGFTGRVVKEATVRSVRRLSDGVEIAFEAPRQEVMRFDRLVLACHADQALRVLADATDDERRLLSPWTYQRNQVVLHTDEAVLPPLRKVWSSWNLARRKSEVSRSVFVSYDMNRLQGLATRHHYLVTLNGTEAISEDKILASFIYHHPTYTLQSLAAQRRLDLLQQAGTRTVFCGSYFGHGFHEDAVVSALSAVAALDAAPRPMTPAVSSP